MSFVPSGPSPLLSRPRAVPSPTEPDLAWHYGDPLAEQRAAGRTAILVDQWTSGLVAVTGADRIAFLHALASQQFQGRAAGEAAEALWLSPRGQVEHWADATVGEQAVRLRTEPGCAAELADYLRAMRFRMDVEITDVTADIAGLSVIGERASAIVAAGLGIPFMTLPTPGHAVTWSAGPEATGVIRGRGPDQFVITVPRARHAAVAGALITAGAVPAGTWAAEALRIAARRPRFGVDTDAKTLPHEMPGWLAAAVQLDKGCYRGQETVARIHNLGAPPRRLVLLNLDGSAERLPAVGEPVQAADGRAAGRVGGAAYHHEDGPIALALVKRTIAPGVPLTVAGIDATIDPADTVPPGPRLQIDRHQFIDFGRR